MIALRIEFFKCKRRKLWLVPMLMIVAELLWGLYSFFEEMSAKELSEAWAETLYSFPLLNAMMVPVIAAFTASRIADIEHKGQTFRLLGTLMPKQKLFDVKFFCAAFYMAVPLTFQTFVLVIFGVLRGFDGPPPVDRFSEYYVSTMAVTLTILLIQFVLSIMLQNQMVGMIFGLIGSFLGLFSMFFPESLHKLLVWAYYGVLENVVMDWNPDTRVIHYHFSNYDKTGLVCILLIFVLVYVAGRRLFVKKEV